MKNISFMFGLLLVIHQFFYLPNIYDSFYTAKWVWFTPVFFTIYFSYLKESKSLNDLKLNDFSKLVIVMTSMVLIASDLYHKSFYLVHTIGLCTFTYCMTYFVKRTRFDLSSISGVIVGLLSIFGVLDYLSFLPQQGDTYHLSVFTGNPNLFAASLVFWFFIHKKKLDNSKSVYASIGVLLLLVLSKSRAAIIAFMLIELFLFLRRKARVYAMGLGLVLVMASAFMIQNPYKIDEFSSLNIRKIETKISIEILKASLWLGIGQGNYRKAYFNYLESNKKGYKSFEDEPDLVYIRLSEMSHFTPLSILVALGLPLGALFISLIVCLLFQSYKTLEESEFLAILSLCLMSMTYYLFHFGIILIPCLVLIGKVLAFDSTTGKSVSSKRYVPLLVLIIWFVFWVMSLQFELASKSDYHSYLSNYFNRGRLNHQMISDLLEAKKLPSEKRFLELIDLAHAKMPDPLTYYNLSKYYFLQGKSDKAESFLREGINVFPSYKSYYYGRALMQKDPIKSYLDYLLVLKIDRKYVPAWKNAAIIQLETGYLQEGLYSIKNGLQFYQEQNIGKDLSSDSYYHQLLQIQLALQQKIKETK